MFGLEFSLSLSSAERLVRIMKEHNVHMFSTTVGKLSIWDEDKRSHHADREYDMRDILDDKRVRDNLVRDNPHQLEDFVQAVFEAVAELS